MSCYLLFFIHLLFLWNGVATEAKLQPKGHCIVYIKLNIKHARVVRKILFWWNALAKMALLF